MNGKDARSARFVPRWKAASFLGSAALMLAVCVVARYFWGNHAASAQAPSKFQVEKKGAAPAGTAPATSAGTRPASTNSETARSTPPRPPAGAPGQGAEDEKLAIMAVVNGEQITRQDLAREALERYGNEVLETLVNKQLILMACKQRNIGVTQREVEDEINRMAAKFGLSADRWMTLLEEQRNVNPRQYANDIVWPTLALRKLAAEDTKVSPEELRQGMESNFGPSVRVRIIATTSAEKANQLRARAAANPAEFGDLAKEHSEDQVSASARGLIPPIRKHVGEPAIEKAAFALKEGEVSRVVHVQGQYLILMCEKHEGPIYIAPKDKADAEQRIIDQISDKKLRTAGEDLFKQLQNESKVVNVYNSERLRQQMPGVAATINGTPITIRQLSEECIARHGKSVLDGEINRLILKQELAKRQVTVTKKDLDEEVERAARAYGYERNGRADVDGWLKHVTEEPGATVELYLKDAVWPTVALKNLVGNEVQVSKEDLDKAYAANYGERVEVLAIVLASQRQATTVWDMARNDPTDEFFSKLAAQYSIEPASKANGGRVPPIQRYGGQPQLEEEAFKLKQGELSSIVAIGDKFIIMRCLGRTKPVAVKRSVVEAELRADLVEKKLRMALGREFDRLKESARVTNFLTGEDQPGKNPSTARAPSGANSGAGSRPASGVAPAGFNSSSPGTSRPPAAGSPAPRAGSNLRPTGAASGTNQR